MEGGGVGGMNEGRSDKTGVSEEDKKKEQKTKLKKGMTR